MKQNTSRKRREAAVAVFLSLIFLTVAVYAVVRHFVRAPEIPENAPEITAAEGDVQASPTPPPGRRELCYNILLLGTDKGNGGSDTNILMKIDAKEGDIALVSLPRDTLLHRTWASNKLNYAYAKGGTDLLCSEVSNLLGVPVDFYVSINLQGFEELIDQIGGVDFYVPVDMDYDDPAQDLSIHLPQGTQHLDGADALKVVRWRKNNDGTAYASADIGRIGTQQAFLSAVAEKLSAEVSAADLPKLAEIFFRYVKTDLTLGNLVWLARQAKKIGMDHVRFFTLPGDGSAYYRGESVYAVDRTAALALVNDALNPYLEPITVADMDVLVP